MKKLGLLFTMMIAASLMFTTNVTAQTSENTDVGAKILTAMTIVESADMHFGTMTVPSGTAEVDLAVGGTVSTLGALTLLSQAPTSQAAAYDVTGDANATYTVTLPTNGTVSITDGTTPMQVIDFLTSTIVALDGSGDGSFTVGATLQLADAQPAGTYTGTFDVSVAYN